MENCETCKHKYEPKEEVKISIAEFGCVVYRIPEKNWQFVKTNLSYYSEHEK